MPVPSPIPLLLAVLSVTALEVRYEDQKTALSYVVSHNGETLFRGGGIAAFVSGKWQTPSGGMRLQGTPEHISGTDPVLGEYSGMSATWEAGGTPIAMSFRNYASKANVAFTVTYPDGATGTQQDDHTEVVTKFPAFTSTSLPNSLTWSGSFMQARQGWSTGSTGGPTVFYKKGDLGTVVVGAPLDHFKASSAGSGRLHNGTKAWAPGTTATVKSIPKGFAHTFLLHAGVGITKTIGEWGAVLQQYYKVQKVADVTLEKIGYQTDNGAYYVFCRGNCSDTLLKVMTSLKDEGVPMGYLSFQGSGASRANGGAPWCVNQWGPDGGLGGNYPVPLKDFHKALGVPMQYYAPYFCPGNVYFEKGSQWTPVTSNTSLPGCGSYAFQDVSPGQSYDFYKWFFAKGVAVGMASFEPDFMNQNYNCVPDFIHSVSNSETWQDGMAHAAHDLGVAVQWCYAAPTDALQSLKYPSVTNFRVSMDFCYGESWNVGESSLLTWAVGASPSKDTLWTSNNHRMSVPGCNFGPDHETPAAELHVVVALMTTGPVGISDGLGMTNTTLIKRTISRDGTLLKPSKPLTSIDSLIAGTGPQGKVYSTFTGTLTAPTSWSFVSFKMESQYNIPRSDFYPAKNGEVAYRTFHDSTSTLRFTDGTIPAPRSDHTNTTGGTDYAPTVTTVYPICPSGWVFLGDLSKYVPTSPVRFPSISCSSTVQGMVKGQHGETVVVSAWNPQQKKVVAKTVAIPSTGSTPVSF